MRLFLLLLLSAAAFPNVFGAEVTFRDDFRSGLRRWLPPRPDDWEIAQEGGNRFLRLKRSYGPGVPRRPLQYALVKDRCVGDFTLTARLRRAGKSLMVVFAYQDTLHFNYVHLSVDRGTEAKVHNGIFRVDGADRVRIDNPDRPPALPDKEWHTVKVVRGATGVAVYMDGAAEPLLSATEGLFRHGRVGLGSFDETGDFDDVELTGAASSACDSAQMKLPALADTAVWTYPATQHENHGAAETMPLYGVNYLLLLDFPGLRQWAGYGLKRATLYLHTARDPVRRVAVSTVGAPWDERTCDAGHYSFPGKPIAEPGMSLSHLVFSNGHTFYRYAEGREQGEGWYALPLDPALVAALIAGASHGLALMEAQGPLLENRAGDRPGSRLNRIHSRESKFAPYLELELEKRPAAPVVIAGLVARPAPEHATLARGALELSWPGPPRAVSYRLAYSTAPITAQRLDQATPLPLYHTPPPGPPRRAGARQRVLLEMPEPGGRYYFAVQAVNETGEAGPPAIAAGAASRARPAPVLNAPPAVPFSPAEPPAHGGLLRAWAFPDLLKAHPVTGRLMEEPATGDSRLANRAWKGAAGVVALAAARNESAGFQVNVEALQPPLKGLSVRASALRGPAGARIAVQNVQVFREWYVKAGPAGGAAQWQADALIPANGLDEIPNAGNGIPGQRHQAYYVDIYVPHSTPPGLYNGELRIAAAGVTEFALPVELTVGAFTLPDRENFVVELNTYGPMARHFGIRDNSPDYLPIEHAYYRMAQAHRTVLNILPYSQRGTLHEGLVPPLEGAGARMRVKDWSAWDRRFGPLLDGTAFPDIRRGAPVHHLYLPFHENWPSPIAEHYRFQPTESGYAEMVNEHTRKAPPIEEAFDPRYGEQLQAVLRDYVRHFREKGWTRTAMLFYLNNKYYYKDPARGSGKGTSWWLLDEPYHHRDWEALRYYGRLFREAVGPRATAPGQPRFLFREDVSRPHFQFDTLDGLTDLLLVSSMFYPHNRLLRRRMRDFGEDVWHYGHSNDLHVTNLTNEAWAVSVYLMGGNGIVPWQTIGEDRNLEQPENTAVLYPGRRFGIAAPLASLRLKALRRGQQDVEYLALLAQEKGWDRQQTAAAVGSLLQLHPSNQELFLDDAGRTVFHGLTYEQLDDLRRAVARELHKGPKSTVQGPKSKP